MRTRQVFYAVGMLVSGTANTISCKMVMSMTSKGRMGVVRTFDHPFVETAYFCHTVSGNNLFFTPHFWKRRTFEPAFLETAYVCTTVSGNGLLLIPRFWKRPTFDPLFLETAHV